MKKTKITINPELAEKILSNRKDELSLSETEIDYYSEKMSVGAWEEYGVVVFSARDKSAPFEARNILEQEDYTLFDGHHRLKALIKNNKSIDFSVVVLDEDDWQAAEQLTFRVPIINSVILAMTMSEETEQDLNEFFEDSPNFLEAFHFVVDNFPRTGRQTDYKRLLGKRWVVGLLMHIMSEGNFRVDEDSTVYADAFLDILVKSVDLDDRCAQLNVDPEPFKKAREIASSPDADRAKQCKDIIEVFKEWKKSEQLKLKEAMDEPIPAEPVPLNMTIEEARASGKPFDKKNG